MAYTIQITLDCMNPHVTADWWAETLGWQVEPSDEAFIRDMVAKGYANDSDTTTHNGVLVWKDGAAVIHPSGTAHGPRLYFQAVPEPKTVKNRMHLDLRLGSDSVEAVAQRLAARGATALHEGRQGPHRWLTLADPEGNEFCVSA